MKHTLRFLFAHLLVTIPALHAADKPKKKKVGIGAEAPTGKAYTYKESTGKPRQMEIYFPPNHEATKSKLPGMILFNKGHWQTVSLIAADRFLVKHGLLTGEPTKTMPASGEKLAPESLKP